MSGKNTPNLCLYTKELTSNLKNIATAYKTTYILADIENLKNHVENKRYRISETINKL